MVEKLLTLAVADEELEYLEQHCQQFNLTQDEVIREWNALPSWSG